MMSVVLETGASVILDAVRALGLLSLLIEQGNLASFWKALCPGGLGQDILGLLRPYGVGLEGQGASLSWF